MSFEAWKLLGAKIGRCSNAACWWLGDWLAFGETRYGRRYKDAIAVTGLDYQTLRNYVHVARRFDLSRRRDNLSFQHHAEVCALSDDDQDFWLGVAAAQGWPKAELRRRVRASRAARRARSSSVVRLPLELPRERRWREAARCSGFELDEWMLRALDDAATTAIGELAPGPGQD
jgi:hypothetical protein